eukprot:759513-Hanusia_phi.AAC.1
MFATGGPSTLGFKGHPTKGTSLANATSLWENTSAELRVQRERGRNGYETLGGREGGSRCHTLKSSFCSSAAMAAALGAGRLFGSKKNHITQYLPMLCEPSYQIPVFISPYSAILYGRVGHPTPHQGWISRPCFT